MPNLDRTGPRGQGPMTGRGLGVGGGIGRPRACRRITFDPKVRYFKPQGIPMTMLDEVVLSLEEMEAIRLKNVEGLEQIEAAEKMQTSQSTFQRILTSAQKKIARALVEGKAIKIIKE